MVSDSLLRSLEVASTCRHAIDHSVESVEDYHSWQDGTECGFGESREGSHVVP